MTDRLDRIEGLLEQTGNRLNQTAEQQAKTTEDVDTLLGAVATNEASVQKLTSNVQSLVTKIDDSNDRFDVLRLEAAEDRKETRQLFKRCRYTDRS